MQVMILILLLLAKRFSNGFLMCFGSSGPNYSSNTFSVQFPISFTAIFSVSLGQMAMTSADNVANTWDISIGSLTTTDIFLWARWGNTPGYFYNAIGY